MKVTFFSGTASTSTVEAPQIIAVGLVDAEKAQLLSEINEQATALIDTAATTAAVAVAPAAADAIRAQVAADADRAAAALAAAQTIVSTISLAVVRQRDDGTWPPRPDALVVHFLGWDDPRALMKPDDLWFSPQEYPTAPSQIDSAAWRAYNAMDGQNLVLRLLQAPVVQRPAILGYQYQLTYTDANGAQVVTAPGALPITVGDTFLAVPAGARVYGVEIRARNYLGAGPWSALQTVTINDQPFLDNFDYPTGTAITASGSWYAIAGVPTLRIATGGKIGSRNTDLRDAALANAYVPPDQFAELTIESAAKHHSDKENGIYLLLRAKVIGGRLNAIGLRYAAPTTVGGMPWVHLFRFVDGVATRIAGAGGQFPAVAGPERLRVSVVGDTVTAARNDTVLFSRVLTGFSHGDAGLLMVQDNHADLNIADDFLAGPTT